MGIEEQLELLESTIPNIVTRGEDVYLGDYNCWNNKTVFFSICENEFSNEKSKIYFYDGWEMFLSQCTKVTIDNLMKRHNDLLDKFEKIRKLAEE